MRIHANKTLVRQIRQNIARVEACVSKSGKKPLRRRPSDETTSNASGDSIDRTEDTESSGDDKSALSSYHNTLLTASQRLQNRLDHLECDQAAYLIEIACHEKIATSQLQIVGCPPLK
jgi:hypothetical protein